MKRHLLIIAICLLLGAVVNVAVAWGIDSSRKERAANVLRQRVSTSGLVEYTQEYYDNLRLTPLPDLHLYAVGFPADAMGYTWPFGDGDVPQLHPGLRPLWPGFAVNTFIYAVILWLLIPGPFALRRFVRLRRCLCPKCAYPVGESAICSECGITLPRRRRMPNLT